MALITREPKGIVFTDLELQHAQDGERLVERNKKPALEGIARFSKTDGRVTIRWTFTFFSPTQKKKREFGCGSFPTQKMAGIRKKRDAALLHLANSIDPIDAKNTTRLAAERKHSEEIDLAAARKTAEAVANVGLKTVDDLMQEWLTLGIRHKDGNKEVRWRYGKYSKPDLGSIALPLLTEK